eukprot:9105642-Lingulodinium_polyedra.AAC.1
MLMGVALVFLALGLLSLAEARGVPPVRPRELPSSISPQGFVPVLQARANSPPAFKRVKWLTHFGLAGATIGAL